MMYEMYDYIVERLREDKEVCIRIKGRINKEGYLEMDWIVDKEFIMRDMPFELFEGEEIEEIIKEGGKNE